MYTRESYRQAYWGYRSSYRTYRADMCTRLSMAMHMCTHAQNRFADSLKQHACYFMDVISSTPMKCGSSAELFLLLHIASNSSAHCIKNRSHVHNSATYSNIIFRNIFKLMISPKRGVISVRYFTSLAMTVERTFVSIDFPILFVLSRLQLFTTRPSKTN
jgi:hypothetical protein